MKKPVEFSPRMNVIQFRVLFCRYMRQIITNPWTIIPLVLEAPFMLVIVSFVYKDNCFIDFGKGGLSAANTTLFLLALAPALMGLLNSYREICKEREILSREVFGGLDVTAYVVSKVAVLAIVVTAMGLLVSALLKKSESAILPVLIIIIMQVVFAGSLLEFEEPVKYLYFITPAMYGNSVLGNVAGLNAFFTMREIFDYNVYASCVILLAIAFVCHVLTVIKLKRDYRTKD